MTTVELVSRADDVMTDFDCSFRYQTISAVILELLLTAPEIKEISLSVNKYPF